MLKKIILVCFIFHCPYLYAQEQPFKSGFRFKPKLINNSGDSLFLIHDTSKTVITQVGYMERSGEKILKQEDSAYKEYKHKKNHNDKKPLIGIINERNEDSLFIQFWHFSRDSVSDKASFVNSADEDSFFVFKITKWKRSLQRNLYRDIPYQNNQFTAVTFPVRINFSDGTVETAFTNATISISRIFGKARIYKSSFLEPRYRYLGLGVMFGVGAREDMNAKNEFSVIYGFSAIGSIYGIKLVVASGWESGFKSTSKKTALFMGIGFGLDIFSVLDPEIKKKEE